MRLEYVAPHKTLAALLSNFVRIRFTSYARLHSHAELVGIPGFWQELTDEVYIWKARTTYIPILVIPYRNAKGLIQA